MLRRALPALAFMGLIFWLSAQPHLGTGLGIWDFVLRKLAHMTEYGVLTLLWYRALAPSLGRAEAAAATIALLYAISDEWHQSFVAGRHASPIDVGIDAVGIVLALLALSRDPRLRSLLAG
jgi:VanZ like protein